MKIAPPIIKIPDVLQLPKVNPDIFKKLLELLSERKLTKKLSEEQAKKSGRYIAWFRKNFPAHRADVFGAVKLRVFQGGGTALSGASVSKAKIYEELKRIGDIIVPFKYSSILVNNNTICGKHRDSNNVGRSLLISIGDYEGCKIVIEGKEYDAKYTPTIFNGSEKEHWNTDDLVGNKYSLVYYFIENDL